ncbi:MAG: hypothetical protein PWP51_2459 [Clostridiales bacterium]|jgi:DNA-binding MarR family transcriptional regulator|uniref:Winged helix DNA-binding protein n=1 Tax=Fusibacter paucivorans TaxID=76009 RepID=A0ABS5PSP3_9FIRM|nr:winged helix DNA-binding protein [Fusibacter paucivorans]MBS7528189.1 winged helix DNA-binding protein [Fusibacter paucivorans]MDK2867081.1 hypothetical protein [Clostridiales bacterium]MDN5299906.1 hypothetical protein [Clostridiales bacterium]
MKFPNEKLTKKAYIYGAIFSLSNQLQLLGDRREELITTKQWFLLANVALFDDFELMLKDISKIVGTSSQNTKKIVNILVDKEYMIVKKEETDGRVLRIALTDNGKKYYEMRAEKEFQYLEALFDGLNDEAISSLYDGLRQFSQVIRRNKE